MAKKSKTVKKTAKKPVKKTPPKKTPSKKASAKKMATKRPVAKKTAAKKPAAKSVVTPKLAAKHQLSGLLTPLDDRLVIQVVESEKMTAGGLYIPETSSVAGNNKGIVLSVGRGHKNKKGRVRPMDVKPGDKVLFDQYAGSKMTLADTEVRILRESEVLGIVE